MSLRFKPLLGGRAYIAAGFGDHSLQLWSELGPDILGVSVASGGTKELIESGHGFAHFQGVSNELSGSPKLVVN